MALPELQQALAIINRSTEVLLIVPHRASVDATASMIALYLSLQEAKADGIDEVSPNHVPPVLQFLPGSSQVLMQPRQQSEVIVDIAGTESIAASRTETLQGGVRVHLSLPEKITLTKEQIEVSIRPLPYDVAIVLGTADLTALGTIFTNHTDFFYNTPIINIDNQPDNEHYGTVNLVDITAGSIAEVAWDLINALTNKVVTTDVATALYAGVIAGTDSFQRASTTPRSFQLAARLMEFKADREAVIKHLVKTKPLPLLRLSGRLYARLRYDEGRGLFWSILRPRDFTDSEAVAEDLPRAMYELADNISGFKAAFVLNQEDNQSYTVHLLLGKGLSNRRRDIQEQLGASRDNGLLTLAFNAPTLEEAEQEALERIGSILP